MKIEGLPPHKAGLSIEHNPHLNLYQSVADYIDKDSPESWESLDHKARAIATNELWLLHWYPDTPVGFIKIAAPTLEELCSFAEKITRKS